MFKNPIIKGSPGSADASEGALLWRIDELVSLCLSSYDPKPMGPDLCGARLSHDARRLPKWIDMLDGCR